MWQDSLINGWNSTFRPLGFTSQAMNLSQSLSSAAVNWPSARRTEQSKLASAPAFLSNNVLHNLPCEFILPSLQSSPSAHLLMDPIPTAREAGELRKIGANNIFDQRWNLLVQQILEKNNGPGNEQEGFVAWGKDGFVRFQNRTIPPDLAKRYAEISLMTGIEIEKLKITNAYEQGDIAGKTEFADKVEAAFQNFVQNPAAGFKVDGGGVVYSVTQNISGGVSFFRYKKQNWFQRTLSTVLGWVKPVMKGLSWVFPSLKTISKPLEWISSGLISLLSFNNTQSVQKEARKAGGFQS